MTRIHSIRRRLLILVGGATLVAWVIATSVSWLQVRREVAHLFDAQLAESAKVLLSGVQMRRGGESRAGEDLDHLIDHSYEQAVHARIWEGDRLIYRSSDDLPLEAFVTPSGAGFSDQTLHGDSWRVLTVTDPESGVRVEICQRYDTSTRLAGSIARTVMFPLLAVLPVILFIVWKGTGYGIAELDELANELETRAPEALEPISEENVARELRPVVRALALLLDRLRARFDFERQFTSDAAHELRTPLAALKTQAQVALAARDEEERAHALAQINRGIDRTAHLAAQLLTLARVEPGASGEQRQRVALTDVIRDELAEIDGRDRVRVVENGDTSVVGVRTLLSSLMRNLIDNALRHGGDGEVVVTVARDGAEIVLRVADSGPGIPASARDRIFDRFYRVPGSGNAGSGLGLSIVKSVAVVHDATVELSAPAESGFQISIRFPAANQS